MDIRDLLPHLSENEIIEICREQLTLREKLMMMQMMNRLGWKNEAKKILARYGPYLSERELILRVSTRWLDRELMIAAFGWDPEVEGY